MQENALAMLRRKNLLKQSIGAKSFKQQSVEVKIEMHE